MVEIVSGYVWVHSGILVDVGRNEKERDRVNFGRGSERISRDTGALVWIRAGFSGSPEIFRLLTGREAEACRLSQNNHRLGIPTKGYFRLGKSLAALAPSTIGRISRRMSDRDS